MTQISEKAVGFVEPGGSGRAPEPPRRIWTRRRIAIVAAATVVVMAAGVGGAFLLPSRSSAEGVTGDERAAMQAAGDAVVNLLTYSRATFDADYQRALAGTTGKLHDDMAQAKSQTLKTMTKGGFDLAAKVDDTALVPTGSSGATSVLVVVSGWTVKDSGQKSASKIERVQMTMENTDGHWLASNLQVPDGVYRGTSSSDERQQVVDAAASCIGTMNTYDYRSVDSARQRALACTTGSFTDRYSTSFDQVTRAAMKAKSSQTFEVTGAGLQDLTGDEAHLLVIGQIETTVTGSSPEYGLISAEVTMQKIDGSWLVTGYRTSP